MSRRTFAAVLFLLTLTLQAGAREIPTAKIAALVDSIVTVTMDVEHIPGAAIVLVRSGRIELLQDYGLADVELQTPVDPERTRFRIGSISSTLTALATLSLVDHGGISFDDLVAPLVEPDLPIDGFKEKVRVRHLLSNTAGYDQVGRNLQVDNLAQRPTLARFLHDELVPVRAPGIVPVYDPYGVTLLGHVLERIRSEPYASCMQAIVFEPLGMEGTSVETPLQHRDELAIGYGLEDGELIPQVYEFSVSLPASSIDATAADMGRLLVALLGDGSNAHGRLFSAKMSTRLKRETKAGGGPGVRAFSFGFREGTQRGWRLLYHGGVMRGYTTRLVLVPERGLGFFVACTRDRETGPDVTLCDQVSTALLDRLLPRASESPPPVVRFDTERFAQVYGNLAGCFTCLPGDGWPIHFLTVRAPEPGVLQTAQRWFALDRLHFRQEGGERRLGFLKDDEGRPRYAVMGDDSFVRLDKTLIEEIAGPGWRDRPATPIEATVYLATEQWEPAFDAFQELAAQHPDEGGVEYYSGVSALQAGYPARARRLFERALALGQWEPWSLYYIAATYAEEDHAALAFDGLAQAISEGFDDRSLLEHERWWDDLRSDPRYAYLISQMTN